MGEMNVADLLRDPAQRLADKPALISSHGTLTYGELAREVDRVAAGLQSLGVAPGDRVAIAMHNVPHFAYAYFGILRAGAVAVPLNAMLTEREVYKILTDSGASVVLGAGPFGDLAAAAVDGLASVQHVILAGEWDRLGALGAEPQATDAGDDDIAVLAYTSGTTGEPKGAMLSHANLRANLDQQMRVPETVTESDVVLLALPLFHIFGLNVTLGLTLMNGATGVIVERFEPVEVLRSIQDHRVTVLFGAPPMYTAWEETPGADQYDVSSVRLAVSGAAPLAGQTLEAFRDVFGVDIFEGYGLTETAPTLTSNRMASGPRANSIGKPLPDVELRLIDEHGEDVELGDTGEIVVRGPNVFKGYWKREEDTAAAFHDGWFRTGDVAVMDEEGYLYLVDRKRDLIIVSGFNVFPSEVETALLQNPKVQTAAVVGVPHPYTGEAVKAFVVLEAGKDATEAELLADAERRVARFKCPRSIEIVEELPQMPTGKVLRRALRT